MFESKVRGILLDIEGTTSSISFVYDVMFPFVRDHIERFLSENWTDEAVQISVSRLAEDLGKHSVDAWLEEESLEKRQRRVVAGVIELMDADIKATGLKQLQGLIWKNGFHSGQLIGHLYEEVADCMRNWCEAGIDVRIYSSGSIQAQKLFFGHTVSGDLSGLINGYYDTTTGAKQESDSYRKIASEFPCPPHEILFISDVVAELVAARQAGLQAVLSIRPGNKPVADGHEFDAIAGFNDVTLK